MQKVTDVRRASITVKQKRYQTTFETIKSPDVVWEIIPQLRSGDAHKKVLEILLLLLLY